MRGQGLQEETQAVRVDTYSRLLHPFFDSKCLQYTFLLALMQTTGCGRHYLQDDLGYEL
jgi:hypothetical protein